MQLPAYPIAHAAPAVPLWAPSVPLSGRIPPSPLSRRHLLPRLWASDAPLLLLMAYRPFARVYYKDLEADYPEVWKDDAALATYLRLLSLAEAAWPTLAEVPRSSKGTVVKVLVDAGLVIPAPPYCYRIKGMDAERNARSNAASNAARIRWSNADGIAESNAPSNAYTSTNTNNQSKRARANGKIVDEREWTDAERLEAYIASQSKRTGVS